MLGRTTMLQLVYCSLVGSSCYRDLYIDVLLYPMLRYKVEMGEWVGGSLVCSEDAPYLSARLKVFTLGEYTFVVVNVVLPAMLCPGARC